jgi:hypothetical protein
MSEIMWSKISSFVSVKKMYTFVSFNCKGLQIKIMVNIFTCSSSSLQVQHKKEANSFIKYSFHVKKKRR